MNKQLLTSTLLAAVIAMASCGDPKFEYKGLKLTKPNAPSITSVDVDRFLDNLRVQAAKPVPLEPGARLAKGNRAVIDFAGSIDGTPFEGGTAVAYPLVLGSGSMIPGFEEGITGMAPGQTKNIKVRFPVDYQEPSLAGKTAVFKITVREGQDLERPPLDDEFARQISRGGVSSVSALRKALREQLAQDRLRQMEQQLRNRAVDELMNRFSWRPSKGSVKAETERMVQQHVQMAIQRGTKPDVASQQAEALRSSYTQNATRNLVFSRIAKSIAKRENITVNDMELEQVAQQMAKSQGQDPAGIMKYLKENKLVDTLRNRILEDRVLAIVVENAVMEDAPAIREPSARRAKTAETVPAAR
jgi:trigger factor